MGEQEKTIETHIEMLFSPEDLERWGANKIGDHNRELQQRVMRIFAGLQAENEKLEAICRKLIGCDYDYQYELELLMEAEVKKAKGEVK